MTVSLDVSPALAEYGDALRTWAAAEVRKYARQADTDHAPPENWRDILSTCPVGFGVGDPRKDMPPPQFPDGRWVQHLVRIENLSYGDIWATSVLGEGIGHLVVKAMGTPDQIERWHDQLVRDGGIAAFALTEPHFGSDTSQVATTAVRDGDTWVLNGTKMYCTYGAVADYVVVFATTDPTAGPTAITAFVVEPGTPGFRVGKANEDKLGIRSWVTSELVFDGCAIPLDHRLGWGRDGDAADQSGRGSTGSGRSGALGVLSQNKANMSAIGIALARASIDVSSELLHGRRAGFAAHRWSTVVTELEQMTAAIDRGRRLNLRSQWMQDSNQAFKTEASIAKGYAPPTAERIIRRCMQLLGPEATSEELLLEKWYRDVKILDIFEGSGQVQRVIISRALMGSQAARG
jgi:acyl-CoA dehydrogenase